MPPARFSRWAAMALVPFVVPECGARRVAVFAVYLPALFGMYLASSCYHAARTPERKALLRRFDHAAIYLLIAGTYTPVMLLAVGGRSALRSSRRSG